MTMISRWAFLLILGLASSGRVVQGADYSCDLVCANGGYCTLKDGSPDLLLREHQAGRLIEICVCRPGFTGVACENEVEQCAEPERRCHNGAPCKEDRDGKWMCNCGIADSLSHFAGKMCRKPYTEYCSGRYQPDSALSFCTNGGRCKADFIAARMAPGDTSANLQYQHAGCVCPPEFYGPHCEFLKVNMLEDSGIPSTKNINKSAKASIWAAVISILVVVMVAVAFVAYQRRPHRRPRRVQFQQETNLSPLAEEDDEELDFNAPFRRERPLLVSITEELVSDMG